MAIIFRDAERLRQTSTVCTDQGSSLLFNKRKWPQLGRPPPSAWVKYAWEGVSLFLLQVFISGFISAIHYLLVAPAQRNVLEDLASSELQAVLSLGL